MSIQPGLPTLLAPAAGLGVTAVGLGWAAVWPRSNLFGVVHARRPDALGPLPAASITLEWEPRRRGAGLLIDRLLDAETGPEVCVFVDARTARERTETLAALHAAGHAIGSRGADGRGQRLLAGYAHWRRALDATDDAIADATGRRPRLFRPPHGIKSPAMLHEVTAGGQAAITWARRLPPLVPAARAAGWLGGAAPGDVLDLGADPLRAADALPRLVTALAVRGLRTVRLPALLGID